jgi:hypothetical protein
MLGGPHRRSPVFDFNHWTAHQLGRVEMALSSWVTADSPADLGHPMRYAVLDGGKRLRPVAGAGCRRSRPPPLTPRRRAGGGHPRRVCGGADSRLLAGARRHAVHGQRRAAPWQTHRARAVWRGAGSVWRATPCRRWRSSCWCPRTVPCLPHCQHSCADNWHWQPVCTAWPAARRLTWPASACGSRKPSWSRCTASKPARCCKPA